MSRKLLSLILLGGLVLIASCGDEDDPVEPPPAPPGCTNCVTIVPSADATLYEDAGGAWANGAGEGMFVGVTSQTGGSVEPPEIRRALIKFNIAAAVPAGATIDSVCLELTVTQIRSDTKGPNVRLHQVTSDWGEGTSEPTNAGGGGAPSQAGCATWIHTFFNTQFWAAPGGDFVAGASASQDVTNLNARYKWGSTAQMVSDVQLWLNTPVANFGWILIGVENDDRTAKRFGTREENTGSERPTLTIYYTP